jgi:hypothetical protein
MFRIASLIFFFICIGQMVSGQYTNILVGNSGDPEEPSIIINPKTPARIVAGANIDNFYASDDGGLTWQAGNLTSTYGVYGDPCLVIDTAGNFYYFHLSNPQVGGVWIDRIICQKSTDGGLTWSDGTYTGLNGTKAQDKPWAAVDPATNTIYVTWTQFDEYGVSNPADSSVILFSKSTDGGQTWSMAKRINRVAGACLDSDNTVEGAVPAIGPNGELYVAWAGPRGIVFNRSLDQGETWMDTNVFVSYIPGGWDYAIPGIYRANGLPVTCCDISNGPYRGNIYINWSDQRNGLTDTDIWFIKSADGGLTWSSRKRVNDDPPGKQQFFTWMTVDQKTGYLYFIFYDRRAYTTSSTDVYMAVSRDGGDTFQNFKISESSFLPFGSIFFGDYTNISAYNNVVRPVWTRLQGAQITIWTAIVDSISVGTEIKPESYLASSLDQNYPNPGKEYTYITFKIHRPARITLEVYDLFGRKIATLLDNQMTNAGKHIEYFNIEKYRPAPGIYYYSLDDGERSVKRKMIVE